MNTPDFAFPKTAAKDAESDLKSAMKEHDAHAAINALIRLYVAENLVDPDTRQKSIETISATAEKFTDSPLHGIFDALLARLYTDYYRSNQWTFDRRELPLTPLPKQISEWNGAQFKAKITQLCEQSISNPEALEALPLSEYSDIITCDSVSAQYFPTLLDFAYRKALNLCIFTESETLTPNQIISSALRHATTNGSKLYWQYAEIENGDDSASAWRGQLTKNINDPLASIFLLGEYDAAITDAEKTELYPQLCDFLKKFPDCPFAQTLNFYKAFLSSVSIFFNMPAYCSPGIPVQITVDNTNATIYDIAIYKVDHIKDNYINPKDLSSLQPVTTKRMTCDLTVPFSTESKTEITLDQPGKYAIVPIADGLPKGGSFTAIRCIPAMPIALSNIASPRVLVVNPRTGAPMPGIDVFLKYDTTRRQLASTDLMGFSDVPSQMFDTHSYWVVGLNYQGSPYIFNDVSLERLPKAQADSARTARILTDRAIYHPGDEINWLTVVYESKVDKNRNVSASLSNEKGIRVILLDANRQPVDTIKAKTDSMGCAYGKFTAPTDGLTGRFTIKVINGAPLQRNWTLGQKSITVSDYKMPDFELTDIKTQRNVAADSTVTITGRALSYSGMPMANATITAVVSKASWWRWFSPDEKVYSADITTDDDGRFSLTMTAGQLQFDKYQPYYIAELTATSLSGSTAKASTSFSMDPQYLIDIESIDNVDALKPFKPTVTVVSADGEKADIDLVWAIKADSVIVKQGKWGAPIDISDITPGIYTFSVNAADSALANEAKVQMCVYNVKTDIVPSKDPLWISNNTGYVVANAKGEIDLLLGTTDAATTIFYFISDNRQGSLVNYGKFDFAKGYHSVNLPASPDNENLQLILLCVKDCSTYTKTLNIGLSNAKSIKIIGESFRDRLLPSAQETWRLHLENQDGTPVQGAVALDMYNKALEAIMPHSFGLSLSPAFNTRLFLVLDYANNYQTGNSFKWPVTLNRGTGLLEPYFQMYSSAAGSTFYSSYYMSGDVTMMKMSRSADNSFTEEMVMNDLAMPLAESAEAKIEGDSDSDSGEQSTDDNFDYRDSDVPLAIWAPALTTDDAGNLVYSFTVPNANTTWRLRAVAWSRDMLIGELMRDFVANKPIMVQPNVPRFLRAGDKAKILATVFNNTDSVATITTTIELLNPTTKEVISTSVSTDTVQPMAAAAVSIMVDAPADATAICYRARSSNGDFSDGEQNVIRILPSQSQLIETKPFYLNPGDTIYTAMLPSAHDATLSLTFSENPAWTIVSALPGLRQYDTNTATSAGAAILSAAISQGLTQSNPVIADAINEWLENPSDSALISMLEKNEDLKLAMLNCTPWVQAAQTDTERMANLALIFNEKEVGDCIAQAINLLSKLQCPDGGWMWGDWCKQPSHWMTGCVLEQLGCTRALGWLPNDPKLHEMIMKAVEYYDENVYEDKPTPDMLYCLVRAYYSDIPLGTKGKKTVEVTVKDILKHWRSYSDPTLKAMAALTLISYDYPKKARELMASLSQFGVWTPQQGLKFPSVNSLTDYAIILEAYATITPEAREVDGLRQQLIVRKQGTDWGSAVVTSQAICSILQSGSAWTVPAEGAKITVGNAAIEPSSPMESATGTLRADLTPYAGQQLSIETTGAGPAYGAVFAQYSKAMDSVSAASCDDLSIEKRIAVRRGTDWAYAPDSMAVGDHVKIMLTIHCKRNLNYVTIIDERAAAFEPSDQVPGWLYSEGLAFYRENRDSFTGLYVDYMRPGTYQLSYEMEVTVAGQFSSGVATIQSQYAPELSAHSAGAMLHVE